MTKVPFNRPSLVGNEVAFLRDAIRRGQLAGDGLYTQKCNEKIRELTGSQCALLTHSCTAALEMAAILCDLAPGDEVIMPSFTFVSTANAVALRGATPVFVDIDPATLNINVDKVAAAITENSKAIFAVHYAGFAADMDRLAEISETNGLILVEDAAQAFGSAYKGRPCGSLGDMATFSFHETKNIISGEGGALTVNRPDLVERAEIIRDKGTNRSKFLRGQVDKYTWVDVGSSFLPGELVASFLFAQLEMAPLINQRRLATFQRYLEAFDGLGGSGRVGLPRWDEHNTGNGHMFYLLMRNIDDRDAFINHMGENGIIAPFHYVPLHSSPAGHRLSRQSGALDVTDMIAQKLVRLPMFFELGAQIETVIEVATDYFANNNDRMV